MRQQQAKHFLPKANSLNSDPGGGACGSLGMAQTGLKALSSKDPWLYPAFPGDGSQQQVKLFVVSV